MKIAVIGNYPPRKCGIATFTENFVESLLNVKDTITLSYNEIDVFAMNDRVKGYDYPEIVKQGVRQNNIDDYYDVVKIINQGDYDFCHIQHEFGIFGGQSGLFVNVFLTQIKIPVFITLHTVLKSYNFHQQRIMENIELFSTRIIVMSQLARKILITDHHITTERILVIQHGAPVFKTFDRIEAKKALGWSDYTILMTFGLIGRSKGLETAIKALPQACKIFPEIRYVILGKTHPHIIEHEGEIYREYLSQLATDLGVNENVIFLDKYVNEPELTNYLQACDIYLTPYLNEAQISSGTLAYAVCSGAAVISTPYWHATELLADGRGLFFGFREHEELDKLIINLLSNPKQLKSTQEAAYNYGKTISWPIIGAESHMHFRYIIDNHVIKFKKIEDLFLERIPEFSLAHFNSLSDSTGIMQHASYTVPDLNHGYCTDDNARALIMAVKQNRLSQSADSEALITKFLSFIHYMQLENGFFINMLSYSRQHLQNNLSEDSFGRALWALGYTVRFAPLQNQREFANEMFLKAVQYFEKLNDLRGIANTIIGLFYYLKANPDNLSLQIMLEKFLQKMYNSYIAIADKNWQWYEHKLSYDNAILPLAMFLGATYIKNPEYLNVASKSINFLEKFSFKNNHLSLIGNDNWMEKGQTKSLFGQQPVDAMAMVLLYQCLYRLTGDTIYKTKLEIAFSWFLGNNDLYMSLYDKQTKGCADGLFEDNVNLNQGGESLLAWLIAYLTYLSVDENC